MRGLRVSGGADVPLSQHQNTLEAMGLTEIRGVEKKKPRSPGGVPATRLAATAPLMDVGVSVFVWVRVGVAMVLCFLFGNARISLP